METQLKYTVQSGDTLSSIINRINSASKISLSEIEKANPDINPNQISIGQVINIPFLSEKSNQLSSQSNISAEHIGYWDWTYYPSQPPNGVTIGIAFSGYVKPDLALENAAKVKNSLAGEKYICLGGGNQNGSFDSEILANIISAIKSDKFLDYEGIAFDIEVGTEGLSNAFKTCFAAAQSQKLKVLVTVSHSAPYGIKDGADLMEAFFDDENINFLSPQLYTTGKEPSNQYSTSHGVEWTAYSKSKAAIIPSIVEPSYYKDAIIFFKKNNVSLGGFIRWNH